MVWKRSKEKSRVERPRQEVGESGLEGRCAARPGAGNHSGALEAHHSSQDLALNILPRGHHRKNI